MFGCHYHMLRLKLNYIMPPNQTCFSTEMNKQRSHNWNGSMTLEHGLWTIALDSWYGLALRVVWTLGMYSSRIWINDSAFDA